MGATGNQSANYDMLLNGPWAVIVIVYHAKEEELDSKEVLLFFL